MVPEQTSNGIRLRSMLTFILRMRRPGAQWAAASWGRIFRNSHRIRRRAVSHIIHNYFKKIKPIQRGRSAYYCQGADVFFNSF
jgi:hypothetical protein